MLVQIGKVSYLCIFGQSKAQRSYKPRTPKSPDNMCPVCGQNFLSIMSMKRHLLEVRQNHTSLLSFFFSASLLFLDNLYLYLFLPIKTHEKLQYTCPSCGILFERFDEYEKHRCSTIRKPRLNSAHDYLGVK